MTAQAFDAAAEDYDRAFTETPLGRELRQIVWRSLADAFQPGTRVWELNCGTGEDAVWLARRGVRVVASDGSAEMLALAARKAAANQVSDRIEFLRYDFSTPAAGRPVFEFDGALSNFGGLNCIPDLRAVAKVLARSIKPGGRLIVVIMGRWCAWEILWHLGHFQPVRAFRRFARGGTASSLGSGTVRVWYPAAGTVQRAFHPEFKIRRIRGLGVTLPPSYLQQRVARRDGLFRLLCRLEHSRICTTLLNRLGDHILYDLERTPIKTRESG
jgi:SAM-dependent methyltransferase